MLSKTNIKTKYLAWLVLLLIMLLTGCGANISAPVSGDFVTYVLRDGTGTIDVSVTLDEGNVEAKIDQLLVLLNYEDESNTYRKTIPSGVEVNDYKLEEGALEIAFDVDYNDIPKATEVLVRYAVVRTMLQLPEVDTVSFSVNGLPLFDGSGRMVGAMDETSFLQGLGDTGASRETKVLTLYFSSADGRALIREDREVLYSSDSSTPLSKLIIKQLMMGPSNSALEKTIPSDTVLLSTSVTDGVCYVNFDSCFMNQNMNIDEEIIIYSIVDSLVSIDGITKVQFYIDGQPVGIYRQNIDLSVPLSEDYSFILQQ